MNHYMTRQELQVSAELRRGSKFRLTYGPLVVGDARNSDDE